MSTWKVSALLLVFSVFLECRCQQYDFGAEIARQCLVPDPVGLLDCVENKVTLPYLTSWVDCTNSLGQNVRTSADIINYRCKSVWEGKGVIPEVFYIKDCVIEKTGLPAKNVSAEVLGAYKECERNPSSQGQQRSLGQIPAQGGIKTAPIQQQQVSISAPLIPVPQPAPVSLSQSGVKTVPVQQQQFIRAPQIPVAQPPSVSLSQGGVKTVPVQQQQFNTAGYGQQQPVPRPPPQQQPVSQQFFVLYPRPPLPVQQQFSSNPNQATQQQIPVTFTTQQQIPVSYTPQQQVGKTSYSPPVQQISQYSVDVPSPVQSVQQVPSGPYYYQFQIRHS
ncbi:hypothetical protein AVEN_211850-1 [Araneus ventricosus]|uniref:Uncharacterized protein n=1 Tax=Araneus ventricosus TaxID=182803 RepID=A0A4Y2IL57_ARAVE|nr:hypothetical protein AVEN_211850-1 [Araneus ventricosus]